MRVIRVHLLHAPDPDTEPNPDLEAAAIRDGLVFALPPHKGDTFTPGQLSQALLGAQLTPIVRYVEHAPWLPSHDNDAEAVAVVTCHCRDVPSTTSSRSSVRRRDRATVVCGMIGPCRH